MSKKCNLFLLQFQMKPLNCHEILISNFNFGSENLIITAIEGQPAVSQCCCCDIREVTKSQPNGGVDAEFSEELSHK